MQGYPSRLLALSEKCPVAMQQRDQWGIKEFVLVKEVGSGAASTVYYAICRKSTQPVAIKMYLKAKLSKLNRKQVEREVILHSSLNHPHIIDFYAAFEDDERIYLVQEFAAGGDLFDDVKRRGGRMSEAEVVQQVLHPYLSALTYLHARGIIHRDIKPENTVFSKERVLKVTDFGLAINAGLERPVTRLGTLDYMAPEVLRCPDKHGPDDNKDRADLEYDASVDAWAMGVLAFELIVGRPPFGMSCREDTMRAITAAAPAIPDWLSPAAADFIRAALQRVPGKRPEAAVLLHHPWIQAYVRGDPRAAAVGQTAQQQQQLGLHAGSAGPSRFMQNVPPAASSVSAATSSNSFTMPARPHTASLAAAGATAGGSASFVHLSPYRSHLLGHTTASASASELGGMGSGSPAPPAARHGMAGLDGAASSSGVMQQPAGHGTNGSGQQHDAFAVHTAHLRPAKRQVQRCQSAFIEPGVGLANALALQMQVAGHKANDNSYWVTDGDGFSYDPLGALSSLGVAAAAGGGASGSSSNNGTMLNAAPGSTSQQLQQHLHALAAMQQQQQQGALPPGLGRVGTYSSQQHQQAVLLAAMASAAPGSPLHAASLAAAAASGQHHEVQEMLLGRGQPREADMACGELDGVNGNGQVAALGADYYRLHLEDLRSMWEGGGGGRPGSRGITGRSLSRSFTAKGTGLPRVGSTTGGGAGGGGPPSLRMASLTGSSSMKRRTPDTSDWDSPPHVQLAPAAHLQVGTPGSPLARAPDALLFSPTSATAAAAAGAGAASVFGGMASAPLIGGAASVGGAGPAAVPPLRMQLGGASFSSMGNGRPSRLSKAIKRTDSMDLGSEHPLGAGGGNSDGSGCSAGGGHGGIRSPRSATARCSGASGAVAAFDQLTLAGNAFAVGGQPMSGGGAALAHFASTDMDDACSNLGFAAGGGMSSALLAQAAAGAGLQQHLQPSGMAVNSTGAFFMPQSSPTGSSLYSQGSGQPSAASILPSGMQRVGSASNGGGATLQQQHQQAMASLWQHQQHQQAVMAAAAAAVHHQAAAAASAAQHQAQQQAQQVLVQLNMPQLNLSQLRSHPINSPLNTPWATPLNSPAARGVRHNQLAPQASPTFNALLELMEAEGVLTMPGPEGPLAGLHQQQQQQHEWALPADLGSGGGAASMDVDGSGGPLRSAASSATWPAVQQAAAAAAANDRWAAALGAATAASNAVGTRSIASTEQQQQQHRASAATATASHHLLSPQLLRTNSLSSSTPHTLSPLGRDQSQARPAVQSLQARPRSLNKAQVDQQVNQFINSSTSASPAAGSQGAAGPFFSASGGVTGQQQALQLQQHLAAAMSANGVLNSALGGSAAAGGNAPVAAAQQQQQQLAAPGPSGRGSVNLMAAFASAAPTPAASLGPLPPSATAGAAGLPGAAAGTASNGGGSAVGPSPLGLRCSHGSRGSSDTSNATTQGTVACDSVTLMQL